MDSGPARPPNGGPGAVPAGRNGNRGMGGTRRWRGVTITALRPQKGVTAMSRPLLQSDVPGFLVRRGKVRDIYDLGDRLVLVATDRISAFDWVLPTGIPDKGRVLTGLTVFWLKFLGVPNHQLSTDLKD